MSIRPRLVAFRYRYRTLLFEQHPQMLSQLVQLWVGPPVVCLDGIGGQVVELPLVVQWIGAIGVAAHAVGGQVTHTGFGSGGRVVEGTHQFPQVPGTTGGVGVIDPYD